MHPTNVTEHSKLPLRLSVLDQSPIPEGSTLGDAVWNTVELARLADELGYHRYWLAEHHGSAALAGASPEVLIGPVAAATSRLRIGSGGIMLPHYSPLKIAETFHILSGLYPGRVDLGIGRAAGTSPRIALALQRDRRQHPPDDFREQLDELLRYLGPAGDSGPEPWLLGSSYQSAVWAAELGLPYVFADFINPDGVPAAAYYREHFQPSARLRAPKLGVAAWAICAEDGDEALRLSYSLRMLTLLLYRGRSIPVPSVERAQEFLEAEGVSPETLPLGRRIITGNPAKVRTALEALASEYCAEEVFLVNIMHDHAARRRSYELIAGEFSLGVPVISADTAPLIMKARQ